MIFADDIMLLSASRSGLQTLVDLCQEFASWKNMQFGTDPDKDRVNIPPVMLNGDALPWVSQVKHLGNLLQRDNSMSIYVLQKRGKYIGKVNSLLQEFHYAKSDILTMLINIYATSLYGS